MIPPVDPFHALEIHGQFLKACHFEHAVNFFLSHVGWDAAVNRRGGGGFMGREEEEGWPLETLLSCTKSKHNRLKTKIHKIKQEIEFKKQV